MNLNWIEMDYRFPEADPSETTYFTEFNDEDMVNLYHFSTIADLKALLKQRLPGIFTEKEILEIAKTAFRNRPKKRAEEINLEGRNVVDFIYEL